MDSSTKLIQYCKEKYNNIASSYHNETFKVILTKNPSYFHWILSQKSKLRNSKNGSLRKTLSIVMGNDILFLDKEISIKVSTVLISSLSDEQKLNQIRSIKNGIPCGPISVPSSSSPNISVSPPSLQSIISTNIATTAGIEVGETETELIIRMGKTNIGQTGAKRTRHM